MNQAGGAEGASRFAYVLERIAAAEPTSDPFPHLHLEDVFTADDFEAIISAPEIAVPSQRSDEELFEALFERSYKIISFPGCITDRRRYLRWHGTRGADRAISPTCEGFGMTLRLESATSPVVAELMDFIDSDAFRSALVAKFGIDDELLVYDAGIQKYLDGYEISPHPDIRKKALTYMVNINPSPDSERLDHHTRYLRFKPEYQYVSSYWNANHHHDRCWVPWEWCEVATVQERNNSMVVFAPSDDTLHGVKADYDHLAHQRTQLYGNLWHAEFPTVGTPLWEDYVISATPPASASLRGRAIAAIPAPVRDLIRRARTGDRDTLQKRFYDR